MAALYFRDLYARLMEEMNRRVQNGEFSERGLARLLSVSQPHMHKVLHGQRMLSWDMADRILLGLHLSVSDLHSPVSTIAGEKQHWVPLLTGLLGPHWAWPPEGTVTRLLWPGPLPVCEMPPVAARLGPDPALQGVFEEGEIVLLNRCPRQRLRPDTEHYYALKWRERGWVRQVRITAEYLHLRGTAK